MLVISTYARDYVFTPINSTSGLSDNQIRYILQLADGRMVFTTNGNVNIYDGAQFTHIHRYDDDIYSLSRYDGHYRIYKDGDSLLWIKDRFKLMCIDLHVNKYRANLQNHLSQIGVEDAVEDFFVDDKSRIWVLVQNGLLHVQSSALFELTPESGKLQDIVTTDEYLYLFYNTGKMACYDLSTQHQLYTRGAYPDSERALFELTSLAVKGQKGIYQLRNGQKGGFFFFNFNNQKWERLLEQDYVLNTLIVDNDNTAYVSCKKGIWVIDLKNGNKDFYPELKTEQGETISTEISTVFLDKQGGFWVGTINRGLLYHHPSRFKFQYFGRPSFPKYSNSELMVNGFSEDNAGNILIECNSDYYRLQHQNHQLVIAPKGLVENAKRKLPHRSGKSYKGKTYNALYTDSRGWTWGGTPDGLELHTKTQERQIFHTKDGLSNNFIHALLEDKKGHIWATTSNGITQIKVEPQTKSLDFIRYYPSDGTLKNEYIADAIFESSDGRLFFGGIDGFNVLMPDQPKGHPLPFPPVFRALRLFGDIVNVGESYNGHMVLTKSTAYTSNIKLLYNQNFLTFEFSALNFRNPGQSIYRYKMTGIDAQWQEISAGKGNEKMGMDGILRLSYTNLPPGKYQLNVMATDNSRNWNDAVTKLDIVISPPWWKTTLAYVLYVLFSLSIISASLFVYARYSKTKLERKHKEEILLLRIRNLIEQCNQYESIQNNRVSTDSGQNLCTDYKLPDSNKEESTEDKIFITKAMELVEKNLNNQGYSVEQLSRDLCMDRTGLYRKLILLLDQSPSLFIRNIRLQRAAQLLMENQLSVTQISEIVGFSSTSYMSKCFQEMYGCRPSEYPTKSKEST